MYRITRFMLAPLAVSIMLAAGCVNYAGIDHQGKLLSLDQASSNSLKDTLPPANWPRADWWTSLGDPRLGALIEEAYASNPDLQEVQARVAKANAFLDLRDAERFPQMDASAGVTRGRLSRFEDYSGEGHKYFTARNLAVNFNYTFDLWGGQRAAWESALNSAMAAEVDLQSSKLILTVNVVKAYNQLAYAWQVSELNRRDLARLSKLVELSDSRYNSGLDNLSQLKQVQSLKARSESTLIGALDDIEVARLQLSVLVGKGVDRAQSIERPASLQASVVALPAQLPAQLLGRRPDIVAARWRVEAENKNIDAVKTTFYPNINLAAAAGSHALSGDALFAGVSKFWNVAPTISLPIFDAGRLRSDLKAGNAELDVSIAHYNQVLTSALHEVAISVTQLRSFEQQIVVQRDACAIAQSSYELSQSRYKAGEDTFLDALNIEQQLIQDEMRLAFLNSKHIDSSISLMAALGGGFQEREAPLAKNTIN
ncbi:efflux transporter outer membrane subunit [Pseudomonas sp. N3-W]|uniref:Efflux transporter outer membrane subunit n=1 Tax=Pseudomonas fungipugnans TaxID=3024217 RepID=A0ABT6QS42_9PSED|nr:MULTISPECIES: efflux transporter outer membrane subunit [unclassified Pseudomonas]MDI2593659.1 efflux transporter outer membrane subunit [Pseudomonas sp. 681]UWF50090.1 efflux transporter outer membrane subunit [Pseudomonas sp. N3-W]